MYIAELKDILHIRVNLFLSSLAGMALIYIINYTYKYYATPENNNNIISPAIRTQEYRTSRKP